MGSIPRVPARSNSDYSNPLADPWLLLLAFDPYFVNIAAVVVVKFKAGIAFAEHFVAVGSCNLLPGSTITTEFTAFTVASSAGKLQQLGASLPCILPQR